MQKAEIKTKKHQIDKSLPNGFFSSIVKESILWLGFRRPSMYWGSKVDANGSASKYRQDLEIRKIHT